MKLIDEWKQCWKWFSVQANTIGAAVSSTYAVMYPQLKGTIPPSYMFGITAAIFVAGVIGRLVKQKGSGASGG
jgi:hypothetical protein